VATHFSVRDVQFASTTPGAAIFVTTDVPCHLWLRHTTEPPRIHKQPVLRRGLRLVDDVRFCFVAYSDNEQLEDGDTLDHTFWKPYWDCDITWWLYFWGTIAGVTAPSTSPIFDWTNPCEAPVPPPTSKTMIIYANNLSRSLESTHATWIGTRTGSAQKVLESRQYPDFYMAAGAKGAAPWYLWRGHIPFPIPPLPSGYIIDSAKFSIYVYDKPYASGTYRLVEGFLPEPLLETDWSKQNAMAQIFGTYSLADVIPGQQNEIDITADGIAWLQRICQPKNQVESMDSRVNLYLSFYGLTRIYQTFTPIASDWMTDVRWRLRRQAGTPPVHWCDLYACDADHKPTGPPLSQSQGVYNITDTSTWGIWYDFHFEIPYYLSAEVEYAIVLYSPGATASNYARATGTTGEKYKRGLAGYSSDGGTTWILLPTGYDCYFIITTHTQADVRSLCLVWSGDYSDTPPPAGYLNQLLWYHPQKGQAYAPRLTITYHTPPP